jgi:hypothetical protein
LIRTGGRRPLNLGPVNLQGRHPADLHLIAVRVPMIAIVIQQSDIGLITCSGIG